MLPMRRIVVEVAVKHRISPKELMTERGYIKYAFPRQIAMYRMRAELGKSWGSIGRYFSFHHTTALYSYRKIARLLAEGKINLD